MSKLTRRQMFALGAAAPFAAPRLAALAENAYFDWCYLSRLPTAGPAVGVQVAGEALSSGGALGSSLPNASALSDHLTSLAKLAEPAPSPPSIEAGPSMRISFSFDDAEPESKSTGDSAETLVAQGDPTESEASMEAA